MDVHHTHYAIGEVVPMGLWSVAAVVIAGTLFGLVGMLFAKAPQMLGAMVK